jgi:hypothetical protein
MELTGRGANRKPPGLEVRLRPGAPGSPVITAVAITGHDVSRPAPTPAQRLACYWAPFQRWSRWVTISRLHLSCRPESPSPVTPLSVSGLIQWRASPNPVLRVIAGVTVKDDQEGSYSPLTTMLPLWARLARLPALGGRRHYKKRPIPIRGEQSKRFGRVGDYGNAKPKLAGNAHWVEVMNW